MSENILYRLLEFPDIAGVFLKALPLRDLASLLALHKWRWFATSLDWFWAELRSRLPTSCCICTIGYVSECRSHGCKLINPDCENEFCSCRIPLDENLHYFLYDLLVADAAFAKDIKQPSIISHNSAPLMFLYFMKMLKLSAPDLLGVNMNFPNALIALNDAVVIKYKELITLSYNLKRISFDRARNVDLIVQILESKPMLALKCILTHDRLDLMREFSEKQKVFRGSYAHMQSECRSAEMFQLFSECFGKIMPFRYVHYNYFMFNVARDNISIFGDDELLPLHNDHRSGFYTNILKYNAKKTIKMMWEKNRDDFVEYIKLNKPWYYKDICAAVFETNDNVETNNDINCCSGLPKDLLECIRQHTPIEWLITCFGSVGGISNVDIEKMIPYLPYILEDSNFDLAEHIYLTYEKVKGIPLRIGDTVYNNITGFEQFLFLLQHEKIPDDELALKLIENHPDALYDWGVMRYLVRRVRKDVIMRILDEFHGTDELTSEIVEIAQKRFPDIV